eukprot:g43451.t1
MSDQAAAAACPRHPADVCVTVTVFNISHSAESPPRLHSSPRHARDAPPGGARGPPSFLRDLRLWLAWLLHPWMRDRRGTADHFMLASAHALNTVMDQERCKQSVGRRCRFECDQYQGVD